MVTDFGFLVRSEIRLLEAIYRKNCIYNFCLYLSYFRVTDNSWVCVNEFPKGTCKITSCMYLLSDCYIIILLCKRLFFGHF